MTSILFFIFLFFNIYVPFSFHYAMVINILLLLFVKTVDKNSTAVIDRRAIIATLVLIIFSFVIVIVRTGSFALDLSVNYIYYLLCVISYPYIIDYFLKKKVDVLSCMSFVLTLHCLVIILEILSPEFSIIKSSYFIFNREDTERFLFLDYRKMGLVASYDTSGFLAAVSTTLSFLLFLSKGRLLYFLLFIISASSSFATSRFGMLLSLFGVAVGVLLLQTRNIKKRGLQTAKKIMGFAILILGVIIVIPIVGSEWGINFGIKEFSFVSNMKDDYSEGSAQGLFGSHLDIMTKLSFDEIIIGTGRVFRKVYNFETESTDIGYVRQIFEIGIVGMSIMLFFIYKNWIKIRHLYRKYRKNNNNLSMLYLFYTLLIVCFLIMNYKNIFIFARGSFSLYLLSYYLLLHHLVRGTMFVNKSTTI